MGIMFSPEKFVKTVVNEIIVAYAGVSGYNLQTAQLLGSVGSSIVDGFSVSRGEPSKTQKLERIIKDAVQEASESQDYVIPDESIGQLLTVFTPDNMREILASAEPQEKFSDLIEATLKDSAVCDIETLPIDVIAEKILSNIHSKLSDSPDLINPVLLESVRENRRKLDEIIDLLKNPSNGNITGKRMLTSLPVRVTEEQIIHREQKIREIEELLERGSHAILLSGFGGIGKTSLAKLLLYKIKEQFDDVAWIPYQGTLAKSALASIQLYEALKPDERLRAIINELKNNGRKKLIVIDNADHNESTEDTPLEDEGLGAITGWDNTTVIVTSRLSDMDGYVSCPVDFFDEQACVDVFYCYYKNDAERKQQETVKELVRLALRHTYTVELLARGANRENDLHEYYRKVSESFNNAGHKFRVPEHHDKKTVAEHLKKLFDLQQRRDDEKAVLRSFSALPVNTALTQEEAEQWFALNMNTEDNLVEDGWMIWTGNAYSVHPLVKGIILLDKLPADTCAHFLSFVADSYNYFNDNEIYTDTLRKIGIAESVIENTDPDKNTLQFAAIYGDIGKAYAYIGDYDRALDCCNEALKICEEKLGTDHPATADTYNGIANIYKDKGDYDSALEFYNKALKIYETNLSTDYLDIVGIYNNIANVYHYKGYYDRALELYNKALETYETMLGTNHPNTAGIYNNIANVYYSKKDYDRALEFYNKALKIYEEKLGTDHPDTAATYNNIAVVYSNKGDNEKALEFYNKALKIYEAKLGTAHPATANTYNNIGRLNHRKGDYGSALHFYNKALKIREEKLGTVHPDTASTYMNMGYLQYRMKDYKNGLNKLIKAFKVFVKKYGKEHEYTKITFDGLKACYIAAYPDGEPFEEWLKKQMADLPF